MAAANDTRMTALFRRLPEDVFSPLTGANKHLYWDVIYALYESHFNWDNAPEEIDAIGVPKRRIVDKIDQVLREKALRLEYEEGYDARETASDYVLRRLERCGWLVIERENLRDFVAMRPAVAQLLAALVHVAENRPTYAGGKVQVIHNNLTAAIADPRGNTPAFIEVCESAREFARYMRNIVVRIQDLHDDLLEAPSPRETLRAFFDEFVTEVLIADYKELKTSNHPFRFRRDIIDNATHARLSPELRRDFIAGYQDTQKVSAEEATRRFERDAYSLVQVFDNVERYLERIDRIKLKLERRVANKVRYAERSALQVNSRIQALLARLAQQPDLQSIAMPLLERPATGAADLYRRHRPRQHVSPAPIRRQSIPPASLALRELERAARNRRAPDRDAMIAYVRRHMGQAPAVESDALTIQSIEDFCAFVALMHIPLSPARFARKWPELLRAFEVTRVPGQETENDYLIAPRFIIRRRIDTGRRHVA